MRLARPTLPRARRGRLMHVAMVVVMALLAVLLNAPLASASDQVEVPHCSLFQDHCVLNATTASCTFTASVTFRCGRLVTPTDTSAHAANASSSGSFDNDVDNATITFPVQVHDVYDCPWELTGNLFLAPNVHVAVEGDDCLVKIGLGKMLVLGQNASLTASSLSVDAAFVRIERQAQLLATYTGAYRNQRSVTTGSAQHGASFGGTGGRRVTLNETTTPWHQQFGYFFHAPNESKQETRVRAAAWDVESYWSFPSPSFDATDDSLRSTQLLFGSGSISGQANTSQVTRGGGRIRVVASRDLVVMQGARVAANGESAADGVGGGSGGSVFISAAAVSLTEGGRIEARGGDAFCRERLQSVADCFPAGGGGRIKISYVSSQLEDSSVDTTGGTIVYNDERIDKLVHPMEKTALYGAAGTFYRVFLGADGVTESTLSVGSRWSARSGDGESVIGIGAVTPLVVGEPNAEDTAETPFQLSVMATQPRVNMLVIRDGAIVATSALVASSASLFLRNDSFLMDLGRLDQDEDERDKVAIHTNIITIADNAVVLIPHAHAVTIRADSISINALTTLRFTRRIVMAARHNLHLEANVTSFEPLPTSTLSPADRQQILTLASGNDVYVGGTVVVGALYVHSEASIAVQAALDATYAAAMDSRFLPCTKAMPFLPINSSTSVNFTLMLEAAQSITLGNASQSPSKTLLRGSAVRLCAGNNILLAEDAVVTSNGKGALANQGPGGGDCVGSVGGGGGYGGRGADSSSINDVGDYASGGLAYGTRSGVGMLGSGGGCVNAGAGGGVVMLGARGVVLDGEVHCNGEGGVNGAGGGSGGFLGLTISEFLRGGGKISAVGGGSQCLDTKAQTATGNSSLVLGVMQGDGHRRQPHPTVPATWLCGGGGGGGRLQLRGCEQNEVDKCMSGFDGNYTVAGGASSAPPGFSWSDATGEAKSTASSTSSSAESVTMAAASGSFFGFPCLPGSGGLFCRLCAVGTYKSESNSEECQPCANSPANAHYVGVGSISADCDWMCEPGYTGDFCVSPLQQLLDACGGEFGFALVLLSIVMFLILLGYACRNRKEPSAAYYYAPRGRGGLTSGLTGLGGGSSNGLLGTQGERQHLLSTNTLGRGGASVGAVPHHYKRRWPAVLFFMRWFYWPRVNYPKLLERDLPEHMGRIYFSGVHDRDAPLKLRTTVPPPLKPVLYDEEFRELAQRINAAVAWPHSFFASWGEVAWTLMVIVCFPWASAILSYRRHLRMNALKRIIARYNHACMKGPRARGLLNALKLGYSGDYSLVYLELLFKESSQSTCVPTTKQIGKPSLPLVLLFAGRGTYDAPYFLDPSDLLVRSIPQCPELTSFIDAPWIEFVAELNELLRVVSRDESLLVESLVPVARFLERKMALSMNGTGKLGGLRIYLGRFYVGDEVDCGEEFKLGILLVSAYGESNHQSLSADQLNRLGIGNSGSNYGSYARGPDTYDAYGTPPPPLHPPTSSYTSPAVDPALYDPWRGTSTHANTGATNGLNKPMGSSIREEALRDRSSTSGSVESIFGANPRIDHPDLHGLVPAANGAATTARRLLSRRSRRKTFYEGWLGPVDASLPVPGVLISADELEDRLADRPRKLRLEALFKHHILPRNVPRSSWLAAQWMLNLALLALLMVDLAITFAILVNLKCVTDGEVDASCSASILVPVLLVPPLTILLAPIMGIVSLAIASTSFSRRYAIWNALSMLNISLVILGCLMQSSRLVAPWFTAPLPVLPVISLAVKMGLAYVIERYIAFQETNRRRRGWRGLMKRRLSDASIPPESP
ncbi:hypothetical protein Poli38472_005002 [Pythium oligandrum]|uniref:DUF8003 domain-containing protein n=1 Tax=Pythium oligandrum TaxID=41045 RepID=A0A8K1CC44_PYTOL|nr:hypothetical protein Poli38472_005002 [Pythium oligandrum]|eukprot:TMW59933.1 hypothetical protein Poli38472_005002 [Pythium oligandrum]